MRLRKLNNDQVLEICNCFIKGRGFACYVNVEENIKRYLLTYNYIYTNNDLPNGYYFLSNKFYKNYKKIVNQLPLNKFEIELIKNYFALNVIYFDEEIMHLFLNNPKFIFSWDGYRGFLCSTADSKLDVYIKNICLAHDLEENKVVIGMFLVDLIDLSNQSQLILQPFMLENDGQKYEIHSYNIKNLYYGEWLKNDEESIYNVLLDGIKLINYIFETKYNFKLFKIEYELSDLQFFMPLLYPTKINRFNFMLEVSKIFVDNINSKKLKGKITNDYVNMSNNDEFSLDDLKKEEFRGLRLFKTYFCQYKKFNIAAYDKLNEIRKVRTEPAHKVYKNDLNYSYCNEQDLILKDLYRVISHIVQLEDLDFKYVNKYNNGILKDFYGKNGSILEENGFNQKKYHYYNGYIRLINDKFKIKDAEVLVASNDLNEMKNCLSKTIMTNTNTDMTTAKKIIDIIFSDNICIPKEKEIESFFYGKAYIEKMFGKCKNYKSKGRKMFDNFKKNKFKYILIFADSTDKYFDNNQVLDIVENHPNRLLGSGFIINALNNCFSDNDSNLFLNKSSQLYLECNIWD